MARSQCTVARLVALVKRKVLPRGRAWLKHLFGGGVTLVCVVAFVRQTDLSQVLASLTIVDWPKLLLGICSLAIGYALRILRWSIMLKPAAANAGFASCAAPFLGSIALNNVLPLRVGDVVRALVFPRTMGIRRTVATASVVLERLADIMTLLISLAIGMAAIRIVDIPATVTKTATNLALIGGITLVTVILFSGPLGRALIRRAEMPNILGWSSRLRPIAAIIGRTLFGFEQMSRPAPLAVLLAISMLVWIAEAGLYFFVLLGLGIDAGPAAALFVMALATLSTLLPSAPGYVGPFHLAAFTAVSLIGGDDVQAGSYALLVHLALWLPTTIAGAIAIWTRPALFRKARNQGLPENIGAENAA